MVVLNRRDTSGVVILNHISRIVVIEQARAGGAVVVDIDAVQLLAGGGVVVILRYGYAALGKDLLSTCQRNKFNVTIEVNILSR